MKLFPVTWLFYCCMKCTSDAIVQQGGQALQKGEFIQCLGVWLLLAICVGWSRRDFWDQTPHDQRTRPCPYNLNPLMKRSPLQQNHLRAPFHRQRGSYLSRSVLGGKRKEFFLPSWMVCLDKSTSIWFQQWIFPGWVFVLINPSLLEMNTTQFVVVWQGFF